MKTSNYLGLPVTGSFGTITFERKLVSAPFNQMPIPITVDMFDALDHPNFVDDVDAFITKIEATDAPENFESILQYAVCQLNLLSEYQFNEEKLAYEPLVPEDAKEAMWKNATFELEVMYEEEQGNCFLKLLVEWGGKTVYLLFNSDAELVGRRPQDTDLPIDIDLRNVGDYSYYYSEEENAWISSRFLMLQQWGNLPCRVEVDEALWHGLELENQAISLLDRFAAMPVANVMRQVQPELERLFDCVWQDYDPEYQRCPPLEVVQKDKTLLWKLVSSPLRIVLTKRNGTLTLIGHSQSLLDDEHGIHIVYNENLQVLGMGLGCED